MKARLPSEIRNPSPEAAYCFTFDLFLHFLTSNGPMTIRPIGRHVFMACRFQLGTAHQVASKIDSLADSQLRRMPGRSSTSRRTLLGWLKPNVHDSDTPISRDNSGGSSSSSQASGSRSPETDDGNTSARILESRLSQDPHNRIRVLKPFMPYSVKKGRWSIMPLTASISDFSGVST